MPPPLFPLLAQTTNNVFVEQVQMAAEASGIGNSFTNAQAIAVHQTPVVTPVVRPGGGGGGDSDKLSGGGIAGITIACIFVAGVLAYIAYVKFFTKSKGSGLLSGSQNDNLYSGGARSDNL